MKAEALLFLLLGCATTHPAPTLDPDYLVVSDLVESHYVEAEAIDGKPLLVDCNDDLHVCHNPDHCLNPCKQGKEK